MLTALKYILQPRYLFLAILTLGLFALAARNVIDPDVWWHLRAGQYIAQNESVPRVDPFSYTRAGQPWVAHEWLSELFIYGLYRVAGWGGLIVVFAAITGAAFFILNLRCAADPYVSGVLALWGAWATAPLWGVRPQIISLLFTSLWLLLLESSERRKNLLWWTLPLTLLWVNLHAGFALGPVFMALFLAGEWIESRFTAQASATLKPRLRALAIALIASMVLISLNPNGARMYRYPFETLGSKAMQTYIAEWASPNFHRAEYLPFLLLLLATTAALAWSRTSVRPRNVLLLLVATLASLSSIRMIPVFVLVAVPIVASTIKLRIASTHPPGSLASFRAALNVIILLAMIAFLTVHLLEVVRHQPEAEATNFPATAVAFLETHPPAGPIFNAYDWGGYLIWKLHPRTRVFIDGRADLYGEYLLRQFADTYQLKSEWRQTLTEWRIETVIVPPDCGLAAGLRGAPGWQAVYEDSKAIIFRNLGATIPPPRAAWTPGDRVNLHRGLQASRWKGPGPRSTEGMQEITPVTSAMQGMMVDD
jgi:hypothetical protein